MSDQLSRCCNAVIIQNVYKGDRCNQCGNPCEVITTPPTSTEEPLLTNGFDSTDYVREYRDNPPVDPPSTEVEEIMKNLDIDFHNYYNGKWNFNGLKPTEKATQAITALLLKERKDGMLEGFKMSGEGWNGEYPYGDRNATDEEILADILPKELQAQLTKGGSDV